MYSRVRFTFSASVPTETLAVRARFFTSPQLAPSGVSFGQSLPQWVLWRSRASKFGWLLLSGDWSLRRWLRVDRVFVRSRSWVMPTRPLRQFPVARACWILLVMMPGLTAAPMRTPFRRLLMRLNW